MEHISSAELRAVSGKIDLPVEGWLQQFGEFIVAVKAGFEQSLRFHANDWQPCWFT